MIVVEFSKKQPDGSWADQRIEVPETKDPFAVLERARQAVFPGVKSDPNWKHPNAVPVSKPANPKPPPPPLARAQFGGEAADRDQLWTVRVERDADLGPNPLIPVRDSGSSGTTAARPAAEPALATRAPESRRMEGQSSPALLASPARGVRDTSVEAYSRLRSSGKLSAQQARVLSVWDKDRRATFTRQEIAELTSLGINAVCGRVNELMKEPLYVLVELAEKKRCLVTHNHVNALALASEYRGEDR